MSRDGIGRRAPASPEDGGTPDDGAAPVRGTPVGAPDELGPCRPASGPPSAAVRRDGPAGAAASAPLALAALALLAGAVAAGLVPRSDAPSPVRSPAAAAAAVDEDVHEPGDEPGAVRLVVVEARPDPDADPRADVLAVRLAVEGRGGVDVLVLGGGSGEPGHRVPGRVALTGAGWLASRADAPVVVRAGGTTDVVLTVHVGCEPAPALAPWLLVRPTAGALELAELEVADPGARGALEDACAAREVERARLASPLAPVPAPGTPSGGRSGAGGARAAP
ncbi:hypothetical protein GCM10009756_13500 [Pseudokineococcus marinus]|uniref:hypothetical protein n=1 Tax=Pseudokineococcus marinus TaxID=351215 RepID=UPI0031DFC02D